jgi:hypothetical protein
VHRPSPDGSHGLANRMRRAPINPRYRMFVRVPQQRREIAQIQESQPWIRAMNNDQVRHEAVEHLEHAEHYVREREPQGWRRLRKEYGPAEFRGTYKAHAAAARDVPISKNRLRRGSF